MSILVNKDTKVLVQGLTGKTGTFHTEQALAYFGTRMVGGIHPKKGGEKWTGSRGETLPIFASVAEGKARTGASNSCWRGLWSGQTGSHHLGASGVTHGLGFLVFMLGLLRRDRAAIAAGMLAFMFYGGMLMTILPREAGVSWESHLGGALAGVIAAFLFRRSDPQPPRRKYSWEVEEELAQQQAALERDMYEQRAPQDVPVLWKRDGADGERGRVLPFRRPGE